MKFRIQSAVLAAAMGCALPAAAQIEVFTASLSGPAEFPPNTSPGTGFAKVTMDFDALTMRVQASFSGLVGNTTAAHIHCCVPNPTADPRAGVATTTPSFTLFPLGVTAGTYDITFDLMSQATYSTSFRMANNGNTSDAMNRLAAAFRAGNEAYFNIHTSEALAGEIRGFLAPIPEPETRSLMLAGLGFLGWVATRRRKVGG